MEFIPKSLAVGWIRNQKQCEVFAETECRGEVLLHHVEEELGEVYDCVGGESLDGREIRSFRCLMPEEDGEEGRGEL